MNYSWINWLPYSLLLAVSVPKALPKTILLYPYQVTGGPPGWLSGERVGLLTWGHRRSFFDELCLLYDVIYKTSYSWLCSSQNERLCLGQVVSLIPSWGELPIQAYFSLSPLQKHVRKVVGGFRKKVVLVLVWESQETHMRHRPLWYDLCSKSGVKPQYNQPSDSWSS